MPNCHVTRALGAAFALTLLAASAVSAAWLPLAPGNTWVYQGDRGGHQTETITGTRTLHGRTVFTKHYLEGADAGLENYWLFAFDGSVLLAGFYSPSAGFGYIYEPPILFLPVPPVVGPQPDRPLAYYDYATDQLLFSGSVRYDVLEEVTLTVPAGTFHAFGVGRYIPLPGPAANRTALTLDGRVATSQRKSIAVLEPTDWFSDGTGIVQYDSGQVYQLVSFGGPTAAARSTWTAIKRLYR